MPEWIIEHGIGESRAALIDRGRIVESRVLLDGVLPVGSVIEARLRSIGTEGRNAIAITPNEDEILLPRRPPSLSEGSSLLVEITRERIPGAESWKRPLGQVADGEVRHRELTGRVLPFPPVVHDELGAAGWPDLIEEARSGIVQFAGGELKIFVTPAMTLIDVDGSLPPAELAVAGARAAGAAVRRLGMGGSIGIDLPTVQGKEARQRAATSLDETLGGTAFERTSVNGFGFLQLIRPRRHASLLELAQDRAAFEARILLRQAALGQHGPCVLAVHPSVEAVLKSNPQWVQQLSRQRGGSIGLRSDPSLSISGGHAEPV